MPRLTKIDERYNSEQVQLALDSMLIAVAMKKPNTKDLAEIASLLDSGADPNAIGGDALQHLGAKGNAEGIELLLSRGARVEESNYKSLFWAAYMGRTAALARLLDVIASAPRKHGAMTDFLAYHLELLTGACEGGHDDTVRHLLARGASAEKAASAAIDAAGRGHAAVVDSLLRAGMPVDVDDNALLMSATFRGAADVVVVVLRHGGTLGPLGVWTNRKLGYNSNYTAREVAHLRGHVDIVATIDAAVAMRNLRDGSRHEARCDVMSTPRASVSTAAGRL